MACGGWGGPDAAAHTPAAPGTLALPTASRLLPPRLLTQVVSVAEFTEYLAIGYEAAHKYLQRFALHPGATVQKVFETAVLYRTFKVSCSLYTPLACTAHARAWARGPPMLC